MRPSFDERPSGSASIRNRSPSRPSRLDLLVPDRALFREAGLVPGRFLRSLDALHVAAAIRLDVDEFVSYDVRQAEAARSVGLTVVSPGR